LWLPEEEKWKYFHRKYGRAATTAERAALLDTGQFEGEEI